MEYCRSPRAVHDTGSGLHPREQGDAGGYAATGISSTSRSMSGYQRLKMAPSSPLSVHTRVCNNKWAPSLDHCICCSLLLDSRVLCDEYLNERTKQRFASLADVMHKLKEP